MESEDCAWLDIEALIQDAAEELQEGELLHDEHFSLYEAMSAVEIGDPKLDAGMCTTSESSSIREVVPAASLSSSDALAVADRLFAAEATWHQGSNLAQTVLTCLYILQPGSSEGHVVLYAMCKATHATCIAVRDLVLAGNVCEDEDFVLHTFGMQVDLGLRDADVSALAALSLAEEALEALQQQAKGKSSAGVATGQAILQEHVAGFLARVRFRRALLKGLQRIQKSTKQDQDFARKQFVAALQELENMRASSHPRPEDAVGFSPDVNRRLMAPVPPRNVTFLTSQQTWDHYAKLLQHLLLVGDVVKVSSYEELKAFLTDFSRQPCSGIPRSALHLAISGKVTRPGEPLGPWLPRKPMLCAAMRMPSTALPCADASLFIDQACLAVAGWCQDMCLNRARQRRRHRRTVEDWAHLWDHAANADASPEFQAWMAEHGWQWQMKGSDPQGPCGCWVEKECASMLLQHLQLGFELDVYAPEEYCMLFWYCDFLHGVIEVNAQDLLKAMPPLGFKPPQNPTGKAVKKKAEVCKKNASKGPSLEHALRTEAQTAGVERLVCQAQMRLAAGLLASGQLPPYPAPFNSEAQRFEQRFGFMHRLHRPEPLAFDQYARSVDISTCTAESILLSATEGFCEARRVLTMLLRLAGEDNRPEHRSDHLQALLRISSQNMVAVKVLHDAEKAQKTATDATAESAGGIDGSSEKDADRESQPKDEPERSGQKAGSGERANQGKEAAGPEWTVQYDFAHHPHYPVLRLKHAALSKK
ncbi:g7565 [Coccomyxa elongata]